MWWSRPVPWACPGPGFWPTAGPLMSAMSGFAVPHQDFYSWLPSNCGGYLVRVEEGEDMAFTPD